MDGKKKKIAFALNRASHYREVIYTKLNNELNADFYFGNWKGSTVKKFDTTKLSNFKYEFKTIEIGRLYWQRGNIKLLFKDYDSIVLTGEIHNLTNWLILFLSKFTGTKIYFWTHGWYGKETTTRTRIKKLFYKYSHKIFLYGDYAKGLMIEEGFDESILIPIYNSLDYDAQKSVRDKLTETDIYKSHFGNDNPIIFFIGRIQKNKYLEQVLEAMTLLKKRGRSYNFVVVGEEVNNHDFESEIKKRKLEEYVWMYGPCYDEKILGQLIYNSNVCVTPSSIGLTAIHSLMYGTPVITNNDFPNHGPEFEAIIDKYNGAFFEKNNIEDLSYKIESVINSKFPKEQCWDIVDKVWNPNNQISIFKREFKNINKV